MYPICVQCLIMAQETSRNIADKMIAPEMRLTSSSIPGARVFREIKLCLRSLTNSSTT